MRKIVTLSFAFFLLALSSFAQNGGRISGKITDETAKPLDGVSIKLLKAADSAVVKINASNKTGDFVFDPVAEGEYLLIISSVGFQTFSPEKVSVKGENLKIQIPTIVMKKAEQVLTGVTVVGSRPPVEQKIDRTVVNVEASVTNIGASAMEVLEKSPGITVDRDGNISMKGKSGVIVLVDGRPTYLSSEDLANMLRGMNANQLDQIEIMTNPPAKFDAAGNSGVINIKTKKDKKLGFNGTTSGTFSQGFFPRSAESLNMNYRTKKVNMFANLSHNYNRRGGGIDLIRKFRDKNTNELLSIFDQVTDQDNERNSYNLRTGFDFSASKKTTIGFVFGGFINPSQDNNENDTRILDKNSNLDSIILSRSTNKSEWTNWSTNFNVRHLIGDKGRELSADVDVIDYNSETSSMLTNAFFDRNGGFLRRGDTLLGDLPGSIRIYSFKSDYLHPLKNNSRFEAGVKFSYVENDNNAIYDSLINNSLKRDFGRSNHFIYKENINAAYVNYNRPLTKKLSAQLGLRLENTIAKGNQVTTGVTFNRNFTQLFPTSYFSYDINEKNKLILNYGRRLNRPSYRDLNPFILFLDRFTFQQGNPNLRPQFSHNIELTHNYRGFLNTTLNYTRVNNIIQQVLEQNEAKNETFVTKSNIASQDNLGIAISLNMPVRKWWTTSVFTNAFYNRFQGIVNNAPIDESGPTLLFNMNNQFKFAKTWSGEISGFYRTSAVEGVFLIKPLGQVSMGISKQIMDKRGTIRLSVRDLFNTQQPKGDIQFSNIDVMFQNKNDNRTFSAGFTYRFGKSTNTGVKRRASGTQEEQQRIGVGG